MSFCAVSRGGSVHGGSVEVSKLEARHCNTSRRAANFGQAEPTARAATRRGSHQVCIDIGFATSSVYIGDATNARVAVQTPRRGVSLACGIMRDFCQTSGSKISGSLDHSITAYHCTFWIILVFLCNHLCNNFLVSIDHCSKTVVAPESSNFG